MSGMSSPKLTNSGASMLSAPFASRRVKNTLATPTPTVEMGTFTTPLKSAPFRPSAEEQPRAPTQARPVPPGGGGPPPYLSTFLVSHYEVDRKPGARPIAL